MAPIVQQNISQIITTCKKFQVESLYLFGSAAREKPLTLNSDIDFVFTYFKDETGLPLAPFDYFDLLFQLEDILGRKVDLVAREKIKNKYFLEQVNNEMIKVYG